MICKGQIWQTHGKSLRILEKMLQISAAVMGIEFSYAAETAFVSPTLLEIGVTITITITIMIVKDKDKDKNKYKDKVECFASPSS